MAMYESTTAVTLTAATTVTSGLRGKLCHIDHTGRADFPALAESENPVVGVYSQDSMVTGEPVTVDLLVGKVYMRANGAISPGQVVHTASPSAEADRGNVAGSAAFSTSVMSVGVALESASAKNDLFQVLAIPYGWEA